MSKLYQCPYCKATKCNLKDPCLGCETFSEFLNAQRENSNVSDNVDEKEFNYCKICHTPIDKEFIICLRCAQDMQV